MKNMESKQKEFCLKKWNSIYAEGCTLEHNCYLDKEHIDECVCYWCENMPIEIHPYLEEDNE